MNGKLLSILYLCTTSEQMILLQIAGYLVKLVFMNTTLIAVKMTTAEVAALDGLVQLRYESRSAAIRAALDLLLEQARIKPAAKAAIALSRKAHPPRRRKSL